MKTLAILLPLISAVNAQSYNATEGTDGPRCEQTSEDGAVTFVDGDLCCAAAEPRGEESLLDFC